MKAVSLFFMTDVTHGGFVSYTAHLARALRAEGYRVGLYKIGVKVEKRVRPFADGLGYQNVDLDAALHLASTTHSLITCLYWKDEMAVAGAALLKRRAALVLHDPTEYKPELIEAVKAHAARVVSIREGNVAALRALGVESTFVLHPYCRWATVERAHAAPARWNAVALSRLDWDKRTHVIAEANALVPAERAVRIYGAENRLYTHHKLGSIEGWRAHYYGRFSKEEGLAVELAMQARLVVDMSVIAGDGDGTQYTFLEAWDAGAALVVNSEWIRTGNGAVRVGENALCVRDARELADVLLDVDPHEQLIAGGFDAVLRHAPEHVVPATAAACGWKVS